MSKELQVVLLTGLVFLVMTGVAGYYVSGRVEAVKKRENDIKTIQAEVDKAKKIASKKRKDELEKEKESLESNLSHYITILPSPQVASKERLMRLVQEKCDRSQFILERFRLTKKRKSAKKAKPSKKKKKSGGFQEVPLTLDANGTYEQFLRFLNSLERHESFLRVNTFRCEAEEKPTLDAEGNVTWPLTISLTLSTFRYEAGGK
jgi:hypothetical protein